MPERLTKGVTRRVRSRLMGYSTLFAQRRHVDYRRAQGATCR